MVVPSYFISILFTICERNVSYYGHQVYGNACFSKIRKCIKKNISFDLWCLELALTYSLWLSIISSKFKSLCMLLLGYSK
jgi:hypothetical protein